MDEEKVGTGVHGEGAPERLFREIEGDTGEDLLSSMSKGQSDHQRKQWIYGVALVFTLTDSMHAYLGV